MVFTANQRQRADLHAHGPIGFQPYWLQKQGYAGHNLLELMAEQCFARGITLCAVTSQADPITSFSVQDRFHCLKRYEAPALKEGWDIARIGLNVLLAEKGKSRVFLINGQTVMTREYANGPRHNFTVVGTNHLPNDRPIAETIQRVHDSGYLIGAEGDLMMTEAGRYLAEEYMQHLDFAEVYDGDRRLGRWAAHLPLINGSSCAHTQDLERIARAHKTPGIAVSNAHRIEDVGRSYIEWAGYIPFLEQAAVINQIRSALKGPFTMHKEDTPLLPWIMMSAQFQRGLHRPQQDAETYVPSTQFDKKGNQVPQPDSR